MNRAKYVDYFVRGEKENITARFLAVLELATSTTVVKCLTNYPTTRLALIKL